MEKVRFTRRVRESLRDLGWEKHFSCSKKDVVKYGEGKYTKRFGKVWITLMISDHLIQRIQTAILCQTDDLDFATSLAEDFQKGLKEIKLLHFFDK